MTVFEAKTHLSYLKHWISNQPRKGYGLKSQLAQEIGTQTGFVTQVFQGMGNFSPEQGILIAHWMGMNEEEAQYFLLLLQKDRAGTRTLKDHFESQMSNIRDQREDLARRLKTKSAPSEIDQATYFSSWIYSYLHVLLTCKEHTRLEEAAEAIGVEPVEVKPYMDFLVVNGLAKQTDRGYATGEARWHIGTNSPHLLKHHLNWNFRAIQAIEKSLKKGMHYSSVVSLSEEDHLKVKEIFVNAVKEFNDIVRDSKGEQVYGFTLNLFD